jgi:hypothetical protein
MTLQTFVWITVILGLTAGTTATQPTELLVPIETRVKLAALPDQEPPAPKVQQPPPPGKPGGKPPTATPPPELPLLPTPAVPKKPRGRDLNLQIEITISDQLGTQTPEKKVVSMLVADATFGLIRASADAQRTGVGMVGTGLNVDARPTVLEGDRILLELTVEYTPFRESGQVTQRPTVLTEKLTVILQSGKPLIVSQAADPVADRKMSVEVRASILK